MGTTVKVWVMCEGGRCGRCGWTCEGGMGGHVGGGGGHVGGVVIVFTE